MSTAETRHPDAPGRISRSQRGLSKAAAARAGGVLAAIERVTGLTPTGLCILFGSLGLYVVARAVGSPGLYMLAYGAVGVLGLAYILGLRRLAVDVVRSELPTRVRQGRRVPVTLTLTARRKLTTVLLEEGLDPHLGSPVRLPIDVLPAGRELASGYEFTPRLRGRYRVGPMVIVWSDPFGICRRRAVIAEAKDIIVHPSVDPVQDRVLSREWEDPPIRPPITKPWPTGYEFYGLRDYVIGDDPRRIVWRATARSLDLETGEGRYLVRESEQGITDRVTLVLDTAKDHHSKGDPSDTFERSIQVIASIADRHIKDGFAVTIYTNAGKLLRPLRGQRDAVAMLDELAILPRDKRAPAGAIEGLLFDRGVAHLVVVTPELDGATAKRIKVLVDRGVSVLLVMVVWEGTDPVSLHRAGHLGCNVVEVGPTSSLEAVFSNVIATRRRG